MRKLTLADLKVGTRFSLFKESQKENIREIIEVHDDNYCGYRLFENSRLIRHLEIIKDWLKIGLEDYELRNISFTTIKLTGFLAPVTSHLNAKFLLEYGFLNEEPLKIKTLENEDDQG
jgi:hypothetical protein